MHTTGAQLSLVHVLRGLVVLGIVPLLGSGLGCATSDSPSAGSSRLSQAGDAAPEAYLAYLIPRPKYLARQPGHLAHYRLVGAEAFHEAVLPPYGHRNARSHVQVHVRPWADLAATQRDAFPPEVARLARDPEAYAIRLTPQRGLITAADARGLQHGLTTLRQLSILAADAGDPLPAVTIVDWPDAALRGAHLCYHRIREGLPFSAPDFDETLRCLERFAQCKLNAVLFELEALFPYQSHPDISASFAFTPDQIREIAATCRALHIELIPKVQCLGHQYHVLTHERYVDLRETPDKIQQFCPTNPATRKLVLEFVDEHRTLIPGLRYFHLGGDESRQLGACPRCRAKVEREGVSALYVDHVGAVCRAVLERGITPIIWSDMLEHHPQALAQLPKGTTIAYWNYHFDTWGRPYAVPLFKAAGHPVIACHAVKSGRVVSHVAVNYPDALDGIADLTRAAMADDVAGFIATNWTKAIPHDLSWRGYLFAAWESWNHDEDLAAFDRAFMALWYGLEGAPAEAMVRAYDDLAIAVPYAESVERRLRDRLDRFDLTGLPLGERIAAYTQPPRRAETLAALEAARVKIAQAEQDLAVVEPALKRRAHEWRLLDLGARTLDWAVRMGSVFDRVATWQRGETPLDADQRKALRTAIATLQDEWALLRDETYRLLVETHHPLVAQALAEMKFETDVLETLTHYKRLLREVEHLPEAAEKSP